MLLLRTCYAASTPGRGLALKCVVQGRIQGGGGVRAPLLQVDATTTKQAVVRERDSPWYRDTSCPEKTERPVLTGIYVL